MKTVDERLEELEAKQKICSHTWKAISAWAGDECTACGSWRAGPPWSSEVDVKPNKLPSQKSRKGEFKISEDVQDVLRRCTISERGGLGWTLTLPATQLQRSLYVDVNKVLAGIGGTWSKKHKLHLFDHDPRESLGLTVATGKAVNEQQAFQSFYTPEALAKRVVELADIKPGMTVLEPSAGEGALADQVLQAGRPKKPENLG